MTARQTIDFVLNGKDVVVEHPDPRMTLLEYIRRVARLTGTKYGCGEGGCGACTVLLSRQCWVGDKQEVKHMAVNACLVPLCAADACAVTTIEALGTAKNPHPVQERLGKLSGSQCGFCTPGFNMSLYATLVNKPKPTAADIEDGFDGNLCRCTGYRPILDAGKTFACDVSKCKTGSAAEIQRLAEAFGPKYVLSSTESKVERPLEHEKRTVALASHHTATPAFSARLVALAKDSVEITSPGGIKWFRPSSLAALLELRAKYPESRLVTGWSEVGVEKIMVSAPLTVQISTGFIRELQTITLDKKTGAVEIGGAATLTRLLEVFEAAIESMPPATTATLRALVKMIVQFASSHIRNTASLASNVMTASPISDINVILVAVGATATFQSPKSSRDVPIREGFFVGYRKTIAKPDEVLTKISIPAPKAGQYVQSYKQARRREDDISITTACFVANVDAGAKKIASLASGYGGMAVTTVAATKVEAAVAGRTLADLIRDSSIISNAVAAQFPLEPNVPGGMPAYRQILSASFLNKFVLEIAADVAPELVTPTLRSAVRTDLHADRPVTSGIQAFHHDPNGGGIHRSRASTNSEGASQEHKLVESTGGDKHRGAVGEPVMHLPAIQHCTGESKFVDDIPDPAPGTLHAAFVFSPKAVGTLQKIDAEEARKMPGFVDIFSAKDVGEDENKIGVAFMDEEIFRRSTVTSTGQLVAVVVCNCPENALRAAKAVKLIFDDSATAEPIINISQSLAQEKSLGVIREINDGDLEDGFKRCDTIVEGDIKIGAQEHFYLETNAALAIPGENDEIHIHASTQATMMTQRFVAQICGVPLHRVVCHVKRMGGGFGGKETRTVFLSCATAFAAKQLGVPVRFVLPRQQDMWVTGNRHPFMGKYRVGGCKASKKILAADIQIFSNAGYSLDLSQAVLERAVFHSTNAYKIPNMRVNGRAMMTNTVTNTAFRGFGAPQGMMIAEQYVNHLASAMGVVTEDLRAANLFSEGMRTHFGQQLSGCNVERMWREMHEPSRGDIARRRSEILKFNEANRYRKRGISVVPTVFGISFTATFMNQAGALVHIYTDGTVLVSHGGTEMGQGLNTKICQIAARALDVDLERIHIAEAASDKVPNASPTAASASSDLYGMAVLDACEQLQRRLAPHYGGKAANDANFRGAVNAAYFARENLSAQGFYRTDVTGYNFDMKLAIGACNSARGMPFRYFTQGVSASEVEVDTLTGDTRVLRSDIIMDLGNSLSPMVDIGQVEGAFVQGLGWCLQEEIVWGGGDQHKWIRPGNCFTNGPGNYKIPSANDVPVDFRTYLLGEAPNPTAVHSSKAVGEPPFFMAASAFFAARNAIRAAREEAGVSEFFTVDSPLTCERVRVACGDQTAQKFVTELRKKGDGERPNLFC